MDNKPRPMKMELLAFKPRDGFIEIKAMGDRGILDVFVTVLVFCFICLFVIGILYIVIACI